MTIGIGKLEREEELCGLSVLVIVPRLETLLQQRLQQGYVFPAPRKWNAGHRTTELVRRCRIAGVKNHQLKSYRFSWAECARSASMSKREAMKHLGHKSKSGLNAVDVHRTHIREKLQWDVNALMHDAVRWIETQSLPLRPRAQFRPVELRDQAGCLGGRSRKSLKWGWRELARVLQERVED